MAWKGGRCEVPGAWALVRRVTTVPVSRGVLRARGWCGHCPWIWEMKESFAAAGKQWG